MLAFEAEPVPTWRSVPFVNRRYTYTEAHKGAMGANERQTLKEETQVQTQRMLERKSRFGSVKVIGNSRAECLGSILQASPQKNGI